MKSVSCAQKLFRLLSFIFIFSSFCGCRLYAAQSSTIALQRIAQTHKLKTVSSSPDNYILRGSNIELIFKNSSRHFSFNGILVPLGSPCALKKNQLTITHEDYISHIAPFFITKDKGSIKQPIVIVLDPGHGGHDNGAAGSKHIKEKDVTLDICKKIALDLNKSGFTTFLTRNTDIFVPLEQRTQFSNNKKASLFVSIHCNSAESSAANGIETFALTPYGQPSHNKAKADSSDLKRYTNNKFDRSNLLLAYQIQKNLILRLKSTDRGVKHSRFHVLKNLNCPGVLVECGFLSNQSDRQNLASDKYRQLLADTIANSIIKFVK